MKASIKKGAAIVISRFIVKYFIRTKNLHQLNTKKQKHFNFETQSNVTMELTGRTLHSGPRL